MSHHQGSSYRPGGDLYRPNSRQNFDCNGQGRPGDRGQNTRPPFNGRLPQQGQGFHGNNPPDRRFQGSQNKFTPQGASTGHHSGYQRQRALHNDTNSTMDRAAPGPGDAHSQGYGNYNNPNGVPQNQHYNNASHSTASHSNANYKSPNYNGRQGSNYQNQPNRFQQRRPADTYHQAYLQTQAENQLWMGDLDIRWTESDIMGIWTEAGEAPVSVKIMRDKMGKPQYSFVTFASQDAVASALQKNRSQIPGSPKFFKLNWASGGGSHGDPRAPMNRNRNSPDVCRGHSDYSLFVGDLATEVTEPELFLRFNQDFPGEVKQVKIMMDPNTGSSKGFGFVRFVSEDAQKNALSSMNGIVLGQRPIRLGLANGGSLNSSTTTTKKANDSLLTAVHIAQHQPALTPFTDPNNTTISIKGIISAITRDELVAHFLPFGHLVYCRLDYANHVAHVKYLLRASAEKALLYMHGFVVNGARLVLKWGRDKTEKEEQRTFAGNKPGVYTAAAKPPDVYRSLPTNVVFEDLSQEEIEALDLAEESQYKSVKEINKENESRLRARQEYLERAF